MTDLFSDLPDTRPERETIAEGAIALPGLAIDHDADLLRHIEAILVTSPLRGMTTPGGYRMSVTTASCGTAGWVSDEHGYRYSTRDPATQQPWPPIPPLLLRLAQTAAAKAGFAGFVPDSCLINCYQPGARMSLHQDKNEHDLSTPNPAPIVSVSLGLPIVFLFGGLQRSDKPIRYRLQHGDVVVWGGPGRLAFHGVAALEDGYHPLLGRRRINLTFRKAL